MRLERLERPGKNEVVCSIPQWKRAELVKLMLGLKRRAQVNQYIVGGVYPSSQFLNSSRQRSVHSTIPHDTVYVIDFGGTPAGASP